MEPFRQKGSSMALWSTFIFKGVRRKMVIRKSDIVNKLELKEQNVLL